MKFKLLLGACALAITSASGLAAAQTLPANRVVHLVVPYPPGGIVDYTARAISPVMSRALARDVVVDNQSGAAGAVALQSVLNGSQDGTIAVVGTDSDVILAPLMNQELRYQATQFTLAGVITAMPMFMAVRAESPIDAATFRPSAQTGRTFSFGSYGIGSNSHLLAVDFARRAGFSLTHVPYRGIAPLLQDLLGGQIDAAFLPLGAALPGMISSGKLRAVAVAADKRSPRAASAPTFAESLGMTDFVHTSWSGVFVTAATPSSALQAYQGAVTTVVRDAALQAQVAPGGLDLAPAQSAEETKKFYEAEQARYRALVNAMNAQAAGKTP